NRLNTPDRWERAAEQGARRRAEMCPLRSSPVRFGGVVLRIATCIEGPPKGGSAHHGEGDLVNRRRFLGGWTGLLLVLAAAGCHNTARGVKADTSRALVRTGQGLEKAGDRIVGRQNHGDR